MFRRGRSAKSNVKGRASDGPQEKGKDPDPQPKLAGLGDR